MIEFKCYHCGAILRMSDSFSGRDGWCRECKRMVIVPTSDRVLRVEELPQEEAVSRLQQLLSYAARKADLYKQHVAAKPKEDEAHAMLKSALLESRRAWEEQSRVSAKLQQELAAARDALREAESRDLERELASELDSSSLVDEKRAEISRLEGELAEAKSAHARLEESSGMQLAELEELRIEINTRRESEFAAAKNMDVLKAELASTKELLAEAKGSLNKINDLFRASETRLESLQGECDEREIQFASIQEVLREAEAERDRLHIELSSLRAEYTSARQESSSSTRLLEQALAEQEELREKIETERSASVSLDQELAALRLQLADGEAARERLHAEVDSGKALLERSESEVSKLRDALEKAESERERLHTALEAEKALLERSESEASELRDALEKAESERERLQALVTELSVVRPLDAELEASPENGTPQHNVPAKKSSVVDFTSLNVSESRDEAQGSNGAGAKAHLDGGAAIAGLSPEVGDSGNGSERGAGRDKLTFVERWHREAEVDGAVQAQYRLGVRYERGLGVEMNEAEAVRWLTRAAERGHAGAQCHLGRMYAEGRAVAPDLAVALDWYLKAAEQGDSDAQRELGLMYRDGTGVSPDVSIAVQWLEKSAAQGNSQANFLLGEFHAKGDGGPAKPSDAVRYFERAAEDGHPAAQHQLGLMLLHGTGVKRNEKRAVEWLTKSAESGIAEAQFTLAACLEAGQGIVQHHIHAYAWYSLAAIHLETARAPRDQLTATMSPEQVSEGQALAEELERRIRMISEAGQKLSVR